MKMYRVYVIDKFSKLPLACYDVHAINKRQAKSKIFKRVLKKDESYLLIANKLKGGADNGKQ